MTKGRLEAFSDGVIAIIITIMVLEMKVPHEVGIYALEPMIPTFVCYTLSFVFVGIYWNNHHHMFQIVQKVNGGILWANMHLLFWLSLIPFVTSWMGENHFAPTPVAMYGVVLLCSGVAYYILAKSLVHHHGKDSHISRAIGKDFKGKISLVIYASAIPIAIVHPQIACLMYLSVAIMWLIPDRRIEKVLK